MSKSLEQISEILSIDENYNRLAQVVAQSHSDASKSSGLAYHYRLDEPELKENRMIVERFFTFMRDIARRQAQLYTLRVYGAVNEEEAKESLIHRLKSTRDLSEQAFISSFDEDSAKILHEAFKLARPADRLNTERVHDIKYWDDLTDAERLVYFHVAVALAAEILSIIEA